MAQKAFNTESFAELVAKVQRKWTSTTYYGETTHTHHLVSWFIQDMHSEVLYHLGLERYDGDLQLTKLSLYDKQAAESLDMVQCHWIGLPGLVRHTLNQAMKIVLQDSWSKGKLKSQPESTPIF